jgi:hypothetical protein
MEIISLNRIISWFKQYQVDNKFLNDFGFGEPYDIGTSRHMKFPYMWVTMNDDSRIIVSNKTGIPVFSFSLLFMDKINDQENFNKENGFESNNESEILSDMIQHLQDLITDIQTYWNQYGVLLDNEVVFFPVVDETTDKSTGINARIILKVRHVNCVIPKNYVG